MSTEAHPRESLLSIPRELHFVRSVSAYHRWELGKGYDPIMLVRTTTVTPRIVLPFVS
jgi:hypothetical protein